jgi:hypothetical protein
MLVGNLRMSQSAFELRFREIPGNRACLDCSSLLIRDDEPVAPLLQDRVSMLATHSISGGTSANLQNWAEVKALPTAHETGETRETINSSLMQLHPQGKYGNIHASHMDNGLFLKHGYCKPR